MSALVESLIAEAERLRKDFPQAPVRYEVGIDLWIELREKIAEAGAIVTRPDHSPARASLYGVPVFVRPSLAPDEWAIVYRGSR